MNKKCMTCVFFLASKKPFVSDKQGNCVRCKKCYPKFCFCLSKEVKPTNSCRHWKERSDAKDITLEKLPVNHEMKNDGIKFIS